MENGFNFNEIFFILNFNFKNKQTKKKVEHPTNILYFAKLVFKDAILMYLKKLIINFISFRLKIIFILDMKKHSNLCEHKNRKEMSNNCITKSKTKKFMLIDYNTKKNYTKSRSQQW